MKYQRPRKPCIYCGKILKTGNSKRHQQTKLCRIIRGLSPIKKIEVSILIIRWGSFYLDI